MSSEDETTQPMAVSELPISPRTHAEGYQETAIPTSSLPSTTIGANTDMNRVLAGEKPLDALQPVTVPNPFALPHQSLPDYHKPMMSQSQGAFEDDAALFGQASAFPVPEPVTAQEPASPQVENEALSSEAAAVVPKHVEQAPQSPQEETREYPKSVAPISKEEPQSSNGPALGNPKELESKDSSIEVDPVVASREPEISEQANGEAHPESNGNDSSLEMSEKERDLAELHHSLEAEMEAQSGAARQPTPKKTRRGGRPVSASQALGYNYKEDGTLGMDSEDEDGGWGSDDERATQHLYRDKMASSSNRSKYRTNFHQEDESYKMDADQDDQESDEDYKDDQEKEDDQEDVPAAKRQKLKEVANVDEGVVICYENSVGEDLKVQVKQEADDDVVITGATVKPVSADISLIEPADENAREGNTINRPRPTLGGVGVPAKASTESTKVKATKSKKTASTSDQSTDTVSTKSSSKKTSAAASTPTPASPPSKTSTTQPAETTKPSTPSKPKTAATKSTPSKSETTASKTSTPKKTQTPKTKNTNSMEEDDPSVHEEDYEDAAPRPKRQLRSAAPPPPSQSQKKAKIPPAELAQILRSQARESIALFLQNHSDDMSDFFTQRHVKLNQKETQEPPSNLFKGLSFIVTGLKNVDEHITPEFIKMQIKVLGGSLVNFRTAQRPGAKRGGEEWRNRNGFVDPEVALPKCILISEKPQRTLKYVTALVNGVPCVHYRWFLACLHQGHLIPIDDFMLPSGFNEDAAIVPAPEWMALEDQGDVPSTERYPFTIDDDEEDEEDNAEAMQVDGENKNTPKKRKSKRRAINGIDSYRIEVIGIPAFQAQWKQTLKAAGARIVSRLDAVRTSDTGRVDYIVSDAEPTDLMIKIAKNRDLPLCTIDWALQCIIQRKIQDPMSKPAYTLDIGE